MPKRLTEEEREASAARRKAQQAEYYKAHRDELLAYQKAYSQSPAGKARAMRRKLQFYDNRPILRIRELEQELKQDDYREELREVVNGFRE